MSSWKTGTYFFAGNHWNIFEAYLIFPPSENPVKLINFLCKFFETIETGNN